MRQYFIRSMINYKNYVVSAEFKNAFKNADTMGYI